MIVETIKNLIVEANGTNDILRLIEISLKISGYLVTFTETEAGYFRDSKAAYHERKVFEAKATLSSASGITKAETEAVRDSEPLRNKEMTTEYIYKTANSFRVQCNEFQQALRQKVSYLRRESENSNQQP